MTRTPGATDKRKRRRYFGAQSYVLACRECMRLNIKFRNGEWKCRSCGATFPAEAVQRVGRLPAYFREAK